MKCLLRWKDTSVREESCVDAVKCFLGDQTGGTFGFESAINPLHFRNAEPGGEQKKEIRANLVKVGRFFTTATW